MRQRGLVESEWSCFGQHTLIRSRNPSTSLEILCPYHRGWVEFSSPSIFVVGTKPLVACAVGAKPGVGIRGRVFDTYTSTYQSIHTALRSRQGLKQSSCMS